MLKFHKEVAVAEVFILDSDQTIYLETEQILVNPMNLLASRFGYWPILDSPSIHAIYSQTSKKKLLTTKSDTQMMNIFYTDLFKCHLALDTKKHNLIFFHFQRNDKSMSVCPFSICHIWRQLLCFLIFIFCQLSSGIYSGWSFYIWLQSINIWQLINVFVLLMTQIRKNV